MKVIKLALFFNSNRGFKVFKFLKKKNNIKIIKIYLAKKNIDKKILKKVKKIKVRSVLIKNINDNNICKFIKNKNVDINLVCGFPYIFNKKLIKSSKYGTLNLHGGRLPMYRGGSPLNWQIINNEKFIGISITKLINKGIDNGPVISSYKFRLSKKYDIKDVQNIAHKNFPKLAYKSLLKIYNKPNFKFEKQSKKKSKYYRQRKAEDGLVLWSKMSNINVHNLVRAITNPYPGAFTYNKKKEKIKILKTKIVNNFSLSINPGEVKKIKNKIYVKCKLGLVQIISHSPKLKNGIILR